jgi:hypothetical protein
LRNALLAVTMVFGSASIATATTIPSYVTNCYPTHSAPNSQLLSGFSLAGLDLECDSTGGNGIFNWVSLYEDIDFNVVPIGEPFLLPNFATYKFVVWNPSSGSEYFNAALDLTFVGSAGGCGQTLCYQNGQLVSFAPFVSSNGLSPILFSFYNGLSSSLTVGQMSGIAYIIEQPALKYKFTLNLTPDPVEQDFYRRLSLDQVIALSSKERIGGIPTRGPLLTFTPIPEPSTVLTIVALLVFGIIYRVRSGRTINEVRSTAREKVFSKSV